MAKKLKEINTNLKDIIAILSLMGLACISAFVFHEDGKVLFGTGLGILALSRKEVLLALVKMLPGSKIQG